MSLQGIQIARFPPQTVTICEQTAASGSSGVIRSPTQSNGTYANDLHCELALEAPEGMVGVPFKLKAFSQNTLHQKSLILHYEGCVAWSGRHGNRIRRKLFLWLPQNGRCWCHRSSEKGTCKSTVWKKMIVLKLNLGKKVQFHFLCFSFAALFRTLWCTRFNLSGLRSNWPSLQTSAHGILALLSHIDLCQIQQQRSIRMARELFRILTFYNTLGFAQCRCFLELP